MRSTAFAMNLRDTWKRKRKEAYLWVMHIFTFPQIVEKQVEKQKSSYKTEFFQVLKNRSIFNIRKNIGKNFSVFIHQIHFDFAFRKKCFPSLFPFPHFFSHFFLFHRASFQEFPQARGDLVFSTKQISFSACIPS